MSEKMLGVFDEKKELYETFTLKAASLVREILSGNGINVHSVTMRTKDRQSLAKKISKQGANYAHLDDVTDIAAVRIITYFEDDVDRVVKILVNEFRTDMANSIDKRTLLDPDRFGYMSTHHVVQLSTDRCALLEYRRFENLKLEIQTRSILQHAWAEIEHDLGYKSILEVPKDIRRRFSRLSGLLELADSEFIAIRDQLHIYNDSVMEEISVRAETADINKDTLVAYLENSAVVSKLDQYVGSLNNWQIASDNTNIAQILDLLDFFDITTVAQFDRILTSNIDTVIKFADAWSNGDRNADAEIFTVGYGISIFYLGFFLAADSIDVNKVEVFLEKMRFRPDLADRIRVSFKSVR